MNRLGLGIQLWTLRNEMEENLEATIRNVAKMGYKGVEFAGYFGWEASKLRALLDELGLVTIGSHVSLHNLKENVQQEMDYLQTLGAQYLIIPYIMPEERETAEQWQAHIAFIQQIAPIVKREGLTLLYHNHDFEFHHKINGNYVYDSIFQSVPAELLEVEMDIGWVQFAHMNPLSYIEKYANRLPIIHVKDFIRTNESKMNTVEVGKGEVNWKEVIAAARKASVQWLVVEQDRCENPPLVSVKNSLDWLMKQDLST